MPLKLRPSGLGPPASTKGTQKIPKTAEPSAVDACCQLCGVSDLRGSERISYVESPPKWSELPRLRRGDGLDRGRSTHWNSLRTEGLCLPRVWGLQGPADFAAIQGSV